MARDGLFALLLAAVMVAAAPLAPLPAAPGGDDPDSAVTTALTVQTAMQQGKNHLLHSDYRAAVYALESQLSKINGNQAYLDLLARAYNGYIQELRLANQEELAQKYLKRLSILDPGAALAGTATRDTGTSVPQAKQEPLIRLKSPEEDRGPEKHADGQNAARELVARAEREFRDHHYGEARLHFEQAHQADQGSTHESQERWAYCKLHHVVEQLNKPPAGGPAWNDLEQEVRQALALAPRLTYGNQLLTEIDKRRRLTSDSGDQKAPALAIKHFERNAEGWYAAETTNFRVFYRKTPEQAEQVAQVAENTRSSMHRKWFGSTPDDWNPKCDIYLHATGDAYHQATGVPANSPGHSSIRTEGSHVTGRRIDLHVDHVHMMVAVLPHEATHVVLAGQFGSKPVPRWADEGMAVLTEPRDRVDRHLQNLARCRQDHQLFNVRDLMQLNDYPEPRFISAFYAQSVSLVDFLSNERGPEVFSTFLRDGLRDGYEAALKRHYGYRDFNDLQQRWSQYAFGDAGRAGVARGSMGDE